MRPFPVASSSPRPFEVKSTKRGSGLSVNLRSSRHLPLPDRTGVLTSTGCCTARNPKATDPSDTKPAQTMSHYRIDSSGTAQMPVSARQDFSLPHESTLPRSVCSGANSTTSRKPLRPARHSWPPPSLRVDRALNLFAGSADPAHPRLSPGSSSRPSAAQLLLPAGLSIFLIASSMAFFMLSVSAPCRGGKSCRLFR